MGEKWRARKAQRQDRAKGPKKLGGRAGNLNRQGSFGHRARLQEHSTGSNSGEGYDSDHGSECFSACSRFSSMSKASQHTLESSYNQLPHNFSQRPEDEDNFDQPDGMEV